MDSEPQNWRRCQAAVRRRWRLSARDRRLFVIGQGLAVFLLRHPGPAALEPRRRALGTQFNGLAKVCHGLVVLFPHQGDAAAVAGCASFKRWPSSFLIHDPTDSYWLHYLSNHLITIFGGSGSGLPFTVISEYRTPCSSPHTPSSSGTSFWLHKLW